MPHGAGRQRQQVAGHGGRGCVHAGNGGKLFYSPEADGYQTRDVSLLSDHLLAAGIVDWTVQRSTAFHVWCVLGRACITVERLADGNVCLDACTEAVVQGEKMAGLGHLAGCGALLLDGEGVRLPVSVDGEECRLSRQAGRRNRDRRAGRSGGGEDDAPGDA